METLRDYIVENTHVRVNQPTEKIEHDIRSVHITDTANVLERHVGHECSFGRYFDNEPVQVTKQHLLNEHANLPTVFWEERTSLKL